MLMLHFQMNKEPPPKSFGNGGTHCRGRSWQHKRMRTEENPRQCGNARVAILRGAIEAAALFEMASRSPLSNASFRPRRRSSESAGSFLGTVGGGAFGWPTMIGATGREVCGRSSAAFPSAVPSQDCESPIQQVPSPAAQAVNMRFSAASAQFSTAQGDGVALDITMRAGA